MVSGSYRQHAKHLYDRVAERLRSRGAAGVDEAGHGEAMTGDQTPSQVLAAQCRTATLWATGFSFACNVLLLVVPIYMLQIYDRVILSGSVPTLVMVTAIAAILLIVYGFLQFALTQMFRGLSNRFEATVASPVFAASLQRYVVGLDSWRSPFGEVDKLRRFLAGELPANALDGLWVPLFLLVVFLFHPWLGVVALIGTLVLGGLAYAQGQLSHALSTRRSGGAEHGEMLARGLARQPETLLALGLATELGRRWLIRRRQEVVDVMPALDSAAAISSAQKTARLFLQISLLCTGAALTISGAITPGSIVASSIMMWRALQPLERALLNWPSYVGALQAWREIRDLPARQAEAAASRDAESGIEGQLVFDRVTYNHPTSGQPVLQDISFQVGPGEVLGVVGPSGIGKTALLRMAMGLADPSSGRALLDGAPVRVQTAALFGGALGYMPQDSALMSGTVFDNIAHFHPAPAQAVVAAARRARAHATIMSLPEGYQTVIDADNPRLSGGQMRRIALARALFGDPQFIVLDEPTSQIDVIGETGIVETLRELREARKTVIVVTHSARLITACDKLLVLRADGVDYLDSRAAILRKLTEIAAAQKAGGGEGGVARTRGDR